MNVQMEHCQVARNSYSISKMLNYKFGLKSLSFLLLIQKTVFLPVWHLFFRLDFIDAFRFEHKILNLKIAPTALRSNDEISDEFVILLCVFFFGSN